MTFCCICGDPVQNSDAVLMIHEKEAPICSACDEILARMMDGNPDEVDVASKEIISRCISGEAVPAVKMEISNLVRQARDTYDDWVAVDDEDIEDAAPLGECAACAREVSASENYVFLKEGQVLCEDCAVNAGLDSGANKKLSSRQFKELSYRYQDLQTITKAFGTKRCCGDKLFIATELGKFAVVGIKKVYLRFQTASLNNILEIKYFDDVQNIQIQTRAESSGAARAVIGAMVAGPLGMVVGGLSGRKDARYKNVTYINNCGFIVTYTNGEMAKFNLLEIVYGKDSVSPDSDTFREAQSLTAAICNELAPFIQQKDAPVKTTVPAAVKTEGDDVATQLQKMAGLVKEGFVTREEFDAFKKKLLGL